MLWELNLKYMKGPKGVPANSDPHQGHEGSVSRTGNGLKQNTKVQTKPAFQETGSTESLQRQVTSPHWHRRAAQPEGFPQRPFTLDQSVFKTFSHPELSFSSANRSSRHQFPRPSPCNPSGCRHSPLGAGGPGNQVIPQLQWFRPPPGSLQPATLSTAPLRILCQDGLNSHSCSPSALPAKQLQFHSHTLCFSESKAASLIAQQARL